MGKKKNNNDGDNKNSGGGNGGGGGGERKEGPIVTVVLGLDMHCEGCATKIKKSIKSFSGVDAVKCGEGELKKLTVIGKLDPNKLREGVEKKVKKKVELISPAQNKKKDNNNGNNNGNNNNNNGNNNNNKGNSNKENNGNGNKENNGNSNKENNGNSNKENHCKCCCGKQGEKKGEDNKKPKEPPVSTAVMKLSLHCQGCIQRIRKTVIKTKGYLDLTIDEQKGTITVKGAIEMKELAKTISTKLKRTVEILPQKKDGEKKGNENEREKEKEKEKENGGKGKGGGGGDNHARGGDNLIHYVQSGYPNPAFYGYGYGYGYPIDQQPSLFSDENPNACSVM